VNQASNNAKQPTTLQTVDRALAFLEAVAQARRPPRLKDVAEALGMNTATSYHLLNTLRLAGYLTREGDGTLRIGVRAAILYQGLVRHFVLGRDLMPVIEELATSTGETAYVSALNRDRVAIEAVVEGSHAVRVTGLYVGFSGSEHIRASGKAILAHLPSAKRDMVLSHCMPGADTSEIDAVITELDNVRQQGWALDDGHFQDGVCCIAVPFFQSGGQVAGSVTVSTPAARFPDARPKLTVAVHDSARRASEILGYDRDHMKTSLIS
jgi:DNA-binding IclR family transcriptional regulator